MDEQGAPQAWTDLHASHAGSMWDVASGDAASAPTAWRQRSTSQRHRRAAGPVLTEARLHRRGGSVTRGRSRAVAEQREREAKQGVVGKGVSWGQKQGKLEGHAAISRCSPLQTDEHVQRRCQPVLDTAPALDVGAQLIELGIYHALLVDEVRKVGGQQTGGRGDYGESVHEENAHHARHRPPLWPPALRCKRETTTFHHRLRRWHPVQD